MVHPPILIEIEYHSHRSQLTFDACCHRNKHREYIVRGIREILERQFNPQLMYSGLNCMHSG